MNETKIKEEITRILEMYYQRGSFPAVVETMFYIVNQFNKSAFEAGQKAERERIKKELGKVLVFNKDIEDILSLTENNQHEG